MSVMNELCPPLTEQQKALFKTLAIPYDNVALLAGTLKGTQVGIVVSIINGPNGVKALTPMAVICDDNFMAAFGDDLHDERGQPTVETSKK